MKIALRLIIGLLVVAAFGVALVPLMVLLDLGDGGTGWGLCADGLSECQTSYFDGFELMAWLFIAMFLLLGMIAACVRILRYLEHRQGEESSVLYQ